MKIDNSAGMQPVDSFFDGCFFSDHGLTQENRGLPAFAQGYGGQAADVTDRKQKQKSRHVVKRDGFCCRGGCLSRNLREI
jgi:hypothetical protein